MPAHVRGDRTPTVLFTCANPNQFANAVPVAAELTQRHVDSTLLALDSVYQQSVLEATESARLPPGVEVIRMPARELIPPFAYRSCLRKLLEVMRFSVSVPDTLLAHDAIVVGMDGAFERVLLQRYRARGRPTAILLDSLVGRPVPFPSSLLPLDASTCWAIRKALGFAVRRPTMRIADAVGLSPFVPGVLGLTEVDAVFTMNELVSEAMYKRGVRSRVETTGNPRFEHLTASGTRPAAAEGRRVLYLTGAFLWHGEAMLHRCQQRDLMTLSASLPSAKWELTVRIHPRESEEHYRWLQDKHGIYLTRPSSSSLHDDISEASVAVTALSTAAIEALCFGCPVAVYLENFPSTVQCLGLAAHPGIPVATESEDLLAIITKLHEGGMYTESGVSSLFDLSTDGASTRIADHIEQLLVSSPYQDGTGEFWSQARSSRGE